MFFFNRFARKGDGVCVPVVLRRNIGRVVAGFKIAGVLRGDRFVQFGLYIVQFGLQPCNLGG